MEPEILDELAADDPEAIRSRRDLVRINGLMGNHAWIRRVLKGRAEVRDGVVEWGAGDGQLLKRLARDLPGAPLGGVDRAPRPDGLVREVAWRQGDVFDAAENEAADDARPATGGVLLANLFLHHFTPDELRRLGGRMAGFRLLCFVEPFRWEGALVAGAMMTPFVNRVTRHDMRVSIQAGFVPGELPAWLGLDSADWEISERSSWRGGLRVLASRR